MPNTDNPRSFSFADPVLYNGAYYPSVEDTIEQNGTVRKGRVFADANGQYFTLDSNGTAVPAMVQNVLPEVTVTPSQQEMLADAFSRHLTMSNDKTQVANTPHRPYNTHLSDNALRGAKYHAQWEREHPNLSSWSYAAAATPFAIAAAPLAMGAGQAVAGTALGQTALNSVNAFMSTPLMEMVNAATGLGFAAKGGYDISQGKFTPETALDLIGLPVGFKSGKRLLKTALERKLGFNTTREIPHSNFRETIHPIGNPEDVNLMGDTAHEARTYAEGAEDFTDSFFAQNRPSTHSNTPNRGIVEDRSTVDDRPFFDDGQPNSNYSEPFEDVDLFSSSPFTLFKARDTRKGELPYTKEEIEALVNPDGTLKKDVFFEGRVATKSHGDFYHNPNNPIIPDRLKDTPLSVLKKHLEMVNPNNPEGSTAQLREIMADNPTGRSGILVDTHTNDTSIDSTPLAYMMASRLGKNFKPLKGAIDSSNRHIPVGYREYFQNNNRVLSNNFGYNNIFKESPSIADRARTLLRNNPNAEVKLLRDENGNMIAYELVDENGVFQIPLRSREEVLEVMNKRLHSFNKQFGTSYEDIVPFTNGNNVIWNPSEPYPWYFGEKFDLPNIYGILYKRGGKLKKV